MSQTRVVTSRRAERVAPTAAQVRIISAALDLFAENGVGGTSLQMIADKIGVTKAAVYHQFKTKEEIVLASAEDELAWLEATIDAADQEASSSAAREALLSYVVDLAVERRRTTSIILNDPVIARLFPENKTFRRVMVRMNRMLMGNDAGPDEQIEVAMLMAAISGAAIHPLCVDFDDDRLRSQLLHLARRFLALPD